MQTSNKHLLEDISVAYIRAGNVYINAQIATGLFTKLKGLLFQPKLKDRQALVLTPCSMVHTCGMNYDIDIVFLDKYFKVVKIIHACSPWRLIFCKNSAHVLKMLGGQADDLHLSIGQTFVFYPASV